MDYSLKFLYLPPKALICSIFYHIFVIVLFFLSYLITFLGTLNEKGNFTYSQADEK
jgi:hypothetical protein